MKRRPKLRLLVALLLLAGLAASCSDRGVHMPKRRKPRHCDCPTFSINVSPLLSHVVAR